MLSFIYAFLAASFLGKRDWILLIPLPAALTAFFSIILFLNVLGILYLDPKSHIFLENLFDFNYLHFALACGAGTICSLVLLVNKKNIWTSILFFYMLFACLLMSIKTTSRGVVAGIVVMSLIFLLLQLRGHPKKLFITTLIIFVSFVGLLQTNTASRLKQEFATVLKHPENDRSLRLRYFLWFASYKSFLENPVFGNGFDNFRESYEKQYAKYKKSKKLQKKFPLAKPTDKNAHNFFLHFLIETGLVGTLIISLFFLLLFIAGINASTLGIGAALVLGCSLTHFQVNMDMYSPLPSTLVFTFSGMIAAHSTSRKKISHHEK
ncbi:MAG: O-antigen ligase family protein [Thermodesulfobacteriota bacterium]